MILLIAIVQSEDVARLSHRLLDQGFRLTQINATGGFLVMGSSVLLIGVEEDQTAAVTDTIKTTCQTRTQYANTAAWSGAVGQPSIITVAPMEVLVGGAVVFGLPVQRFLRLTGGPVPLTEHVTEGVTSDSNTPMSMAATAAREGMTTMSPGTDPETTSGAAARAPDANPATNLVVAIVQNEDAGAVVDGLLTAGHRLTRLNTAGGFFRRGNATLLIGVEEPRLDEVLTLIQANCRPRSEPNPLHAGMPMYSATVFVLDASYFMRF